MTQATFSSATRSSICTTEPGGDDKLVGGSNPGDSEFVDQLYGDAFQMFEFTQGGKDILIGGNNSGSGHLATTSLATRAKCLTPPKAATTN